MDYPALKGNKFTNIVLVDGKLTFNTEIVSRIANIQVNGIKNIYKNGEIIDNLLELENYTLDNVDLNVTSFENDAFNEAVIDTEEGDVFTLIGDMNGILVNENEFQDILDSITNDEDDYQRYIQSIIS